MDVDTVTLFFALLAATSQVVVIACLFASLHRPTRALLADATAPLLPWLAFAVATTCTLGSLYLSEVAHFRPCRLCWVQRGFMYPLTLITLVAAITTGRPVARRIRLFIGGFAALGACVSIYHVLLEHFPNLESGTCDPKNPCTLIWVKRLGYVTIPTMALTGFVLIIASMLGQRGRN